MTEWLLKIQNDLKVKKDRQNNFGGFNYRSAEDILEAVKPLCKAEGVVLNLSDEMVIIGDRYYIKATARVEKDKDVAYSVGYAREPLTKKGMDESQITGSTSSYARKYALSGLFCLDDGVDSDAQNTEAEPLIDEAKQKIITSLLEESNSDVGKFLIYYAVDTLAELTESKFLHASSTLRKKAHNNANS